MPATTPRTALPPFVQEACCPKCGCQDRVVVYQQDDDGEWIESTCTRCSFLWTNACRDQEAPVTRAVGRKSAGGRAPRPDGPLLSSLLYNGGCARPLFRPIRVTH